MIASVSHELRTPLTSVVGFAKLLEIEGSDLGAEERAMVIRTIAEEGVDLANIIDDLLVAAKAESGTLEVVSVPTDLRAQAAQVVEACRPEDVRRIDVSPDTVRGEGDPARVRQILRNLVSNAIRYGGDQIGIEFEHDQGWAVVRVVDDGPGIPDEKRDRVFESYYRGEEDPGLAGSMGLGLSISRQLAERMRGSLSYFYVGNESVFELRLPGIKVTETPGRTRGSPLGRPAQEPNHWLIRQLTRRYAASPLGQPIWARISPPGLAVVCTFT